MKVRILGCYGGESPGRKSPSFLINEDLVLDAGAITSTLTLQEQKKLKYILLTHGHFDHIKDIPFLADNLVGQKEEPLKIIAEKHVLDGIASHIMNGYIWPDFRKIPSSKNPVIKFQPIKINKTYNLDSLKIKAVRVHHIVETVGYFISDGKVSIAFSGDTGPTDKFWKEANKDKNLKAIFIEVSFPNLLEKIAITSKHLTPSMLEEELKKLKKKAKIFVYHLKSNFVDLIKKELKSINYSELKILEQEDTITI